MICGIISCAERDCQFEGRCRLRSLPHRGKALGIRGNPAAAGRGRNWHRSRARPVGSESSAPSGRNSEMEIGTVRERLRDHYCSRIEEARRSVGNCKERWNTATMQAPRIGWVGPNRVVTLTRKQTSLFAAMRHRAKMGGSPASIALRREKGRGKAPPLQKNMDDAA